MLALTLISSHAEKFEGPEASMRPLTDNSGTDAFGPCSISWSMKITTTVISSWKKRKIPMSTFLRSALPHFPLTRCLMQSGSNQSPCCSPVIKAKNVVLACLRKEHQVTNYALKLISNIRLLGNYRQFQQLLDFSGAPTIHLMQRLRIYLVNVEL